MKTSFTLCAAALLFAACSGPADAQRGSRPRQMVRVPAEWEPHAATWMQWPRWYENSYRPAFAEIIRIVQAYEPFHLVCHSARIRDEARDYLRNLGVPLDNVQFHVLRLNSAWMRDNGPVYVEILGRLRVQDWGFDGWGGLVRDYRLDDVIPPKVAAAVPLPSLDYNHIINERGTLEFNGVDTLITSWACLGDRNPQLGRNQLCRQLKDAFGVDQVVWLNKAPADDVTGGHVDGIARFIDEDTVVVPEYWDPRHRDAVVYDHAARTLRRHGFEVLRMPVPGQVRYRGYPMAAIYVNWLVANGVVVIPGFDGGGPWDQAARTAVQSYFPGRDVFNVDTLELWYWGGSVHCVTNDQPAPHR